MATTQKGFTLIELVMVIVVLGILAAVAIPRFFDISTSAEAAAADGAQQVVGSAVAIAMARKAAGGDYDPPTGTQVAADVGGATCAVDTGNIYVNTSGSAFGTVGTIDVLLLDGTGAAIAACATESVGQVSTATFN